MQSRCFACHGELGDGGLGPALAGDPILAIQQFAIARILVGRNPMPAFAERLSDADVVAVANYIRNSWGNKFGTVTASDVSAVRQLMQKATAQAAKVKSSQLSQEPSR
jgi:mono/diheme cytochrome c family protein